QAFLGVLPDKIARQLAVAVEYDRMDGGALPLDLILEALRPALRRSGLKRQGVATLQRAFFEPVEDLLTASGQGPKKQACLARATLDPVWRWLETDLIPADVAVAGGEYATALKRADPQARDAALRPLWASAHEAVIAALGRLKAGTPDYDRYVKVLG